MIIGPFGEFHSKVLEAIATGHAHLQFSQIGEDALIWQFYGNVTNGFYVDVGCHHPFRYSNTALLSIFNQWTGLNIDADQRAIELFNQYRPQDINVRCAVGNRSGQTAVYLFNDGAVNTLDPAWAERQAKDYGTPQSDLVEVLPLRELLDRHLPPSRSIDLMNIDIEGLDFEAIQSNDWAKYRPKLLCVETHHFNINQPTDNPTFRFMQGIGYYLIAHYYATSIYKSNE